MEVTADGQVRDHTVPTKDTLDATSRAVLHALYQQIACDTVDVVRLTRTSTGGSATSACSPAARDLLHQPIAETPHG